MVDDDKSRNKTKINQASLMKRDSYIRAIYNLEINHMIKKNKKLFLENNEFTTYEEDSQPRNGYFISDDGGHFHIKNWCRNYNKCARKDRAQMKQYLVGLQGNFS